MYPTATPPLVLNERVPDPAAKILDPSFEKYKLPLASVERFISTSLSFRPHPEEARSAVSKDGQHTQPILRDAAFGRSSG